MAAVAIGTTVVAVGGAAVSAGMQASAADKAAKAQGAAGKKAAQAERAAFAAREKAIKKLGKGQKLLEQDLAAINAPQYDYAAMERDALKESQFRRAQAFGGEAQYEALRNQAMANISQGLAGQITDAELGAVRREQAFLQGAGFNPAMAGRGAIQQRGQYDYLRAIGRTAGEAINQAGNFLGQWTNIASSYIADPKAYGALQYQYGMGAANVGLQKIDTRRQMLSDLYTAQIGGSEAQQQMGQRQYARQQELNAANFARDTTYAKGVGDIAKAASSAAMSGAGAYGQYATAKGAGGGFPGGFDYTKAYGSATYGGASPGFGNFDYGSGTGA